MAPALRMTRSIKEKLKIFWRKFDPDLLLNPFFFFDPTEPLEFHHYNRGTYVVACNYTSEY